MNLKKITRGLSSSAARLKPQMAISRKELVDLGLVILVSFMIVVYKLNKAIP
jgi:hypothetical protein